MQVRSCSPLRREPLLRQALPQTHRAGEAEGHRRLTRPRRNVSKRTSRGVRRYRLRKAPLPGAHHGQDPERLHCKAALEEDGFQPKKQTPVGAMERDEWLRAAWRVTLTREITSERLVFVDEMGTNTSLHPLYAWPSPKGERARCSVPRNRGPNTTLLASMTAEGMGACLAVEGATTRLVFETYIEKVLLPSLRHGQVVVMDNLSAHKGERVRELVESAGCELLYLPPYSPDFSPIEEAFSKVKGLLRKAQARSREALVEAMGEALDTVTAQDARGFFEHCGYRALGQLF